MATVVKGLICNCFCNYLASLTGNIRALLKTYFSTLLSCFCLLVCFNDSVVCNINFIVCYIVVVILVRIRILLSYLVANVM